MLDLSALLIRSKFKCIQSLDGSRELFITFFFRAKVIFYKIEEKKRKKQQIKVIRKSFLELNSFLSVEPIKSIWTAYHFCAHCQMRENCMQFSSLIFNLFN